MLTFRLSRRAKHNALAAIFLLGKHGNVKQFVLHPSVFKIAAFWGHLGRVQACLYRPTVVGFDR